MTKITPIAQLRRSIIVTFLENKSKYNFQNIIETAVVILDHVRFRVYILVEIFEVRNFFSGKLFRLKFYKSGFPGYFSSFYEFLILYVCFAPKLLFVRRFWKLWVIFEIFFFSGDQIMITPFSWSFRSSKTSCCRKVNEKKFFNHFDWLRMTQFFGFERIDNYHLNFYKT